MSVIQYILGIAAATFTFVLVIEMLRRGRLRERHAIWWLVAGFFAILISLFPNILIWFSATLGFEVPINLVYFFSLFILFLVALQNSSELTKIEDHNRSIVEKLMILELKIEDLQKELKTRNSNND